MEWLKNNIDLILALLKLLLYKRYKMEILVIFLEVIVKEHYNVMNINYNQWNRQTHNIIIFIKMLFFKL